MYDMVLMHVVNPLQNLAKIAKNYLSINNSSLLVDICF